MEIAQILEGAAPIEKLRGELPPAYSAKAELPPAYDAIANLHVAVETKNEAGDKQEEKEQKA